jgi:hypothetical protein
MKRAILMTTAMAAFCTMGLPSAIHAGGHGFGFGGGGGRGFGGGGRQYGSHNSGWGGQNRNFNHGYSGGNSYGPHSYQPSTAHYATNTAHTGNFSVQKLSTTKTVKLQSTSKVVAQKMNTGKPKPGGNHPKGKGTKILKGIGGVVGALQSDGGGDDGSSGAADGDQVVGGGYSQSADVSTAYYQSESPDSMGGAVQTVANALPNQPGGDDAGSDLSATVKVMNPGETGQTVNYVLGSETSSLEPGTANIHAQVSQEIVFDRGGSFGTVRYTLGPGAYRFVATDNGWDLRTVRE